MLLHYTPSARAVVVTLLAVPTIVCVLVEMLGELVEKLGDFIAWRGADGKHLLRRFARWLLSKGEPTKAEREAAAEARRQHYAQELTAMRARHVAEREAECGA